MVVGVWWSVRYFQWVASEAGRPVEDAFLPRRTDGNGRFAASLSLV